MEVAEVFRHFLLWKCLQDHLHHARVPEQVSLKQTTSTVFTLCYVTTWPTHSSAGVFLLVYAINGNGTPSPSSALYHLG